MKNLKNKMAQEPEWFSAEGDSWESADAWESAEGARAIRPSRVSKPYLIRLVNACSSAISDVDLGDSYLQRAASNFGQSSNITITSRVSGTSYIEFLAETESQPFKVGKILIISATAAQFNESITITHRDANGNRLDQVITLTLDPYQQQTDRILIEEEFLWDGYTRLRFSAIAGSATVDLRIYASDKFAATQLIAGRPAQVQYTPPRIVKVASVAVPQAKRIAAR